MELKLIRLILVDDQAFLLDILKRQFEASKEFEVVGTALNGGSAYKIALKERPDAIILDVDLGQGESGFDLLPRLRSALPQMRIVMLSLHNHPLYRQRALELGADAYLDKGTSFAKLKRVLVSVYDGGENRSQAPQSAVAGLYKTLTERELHVVKHVVAGMLTKEIAEGLGVTVSTVSTYLQRAREKLGIQTRAELIREAAALGIATMTEGSSIL